MKKFYSILLMAVALLISTNLKAEVTTYAALQAALNDETTGSTITLGGNIELGEYDQLYFYRPGDTLTLDLNGNNITTTALKSSAMFYVYAGTLNVAGTGKIQFTSTKDHDVFRVFGTNDLDAANYTTLNIGENDTIIADGTGVDSKSNPLGGKTITVMELSATYGKVYQGTSTLTPVVNYVSVMKNSSGKNVSDGFAEGVVINIYGTVSGSQYGVKINGNVRSWSYNKSKNYVEYTSNLGNSYGFTSETDSVKAYANAPQVNIYSTAVVTADANLTSAAAVYSSGYGVFNIMGTCSGNTAVYIKSGNVTATDATISSTGSYTAVEGKGSGVKAGGSAIVIESNSGFTGETNFTISGDTKVSSTNGYAIEETITTATDTKVSSINIEGGTISGGSQGAIIVTEKTAGTDSVKVYGGNITGTTEIKDGDGNTTTVVDPGSMSTVTSGTTYFTTITDPETGRTTIVVSTGEAPSVETTFDITNSDNTDKDIELDVNHATSPFSVASSTLVTDKDMTLGDVILKGSNTTPIVITISENTTLTVKKLTMNSHAQVLVKAGGKFVVEGNQGIVAPSVDNIIIEAQDNNMGQFLFNPAVTSNRHPNATVQLISAGAYDGANHTFQRFGVPVYKSYNDHTGITPLDIARDPSPNPTYFYYWDNNVEDAWVNIDGTYQMMPFVGFTMTPANTVTAGSVKYSMPGELVGNDNAAITYNPSAFSYFANSYSAKMDVAQLLSAYMTNDEALEAAIHIYDAPSKHWTSYGYYDVEGTSNVKLDPMQAFVVYNQSVDEYNGTINYKDIVYTPGTVALAPARRAITRDYDQVKIAFTNNEDKQIVTLRQGAQFSDEYDNGADVTKFMQGNCNVYATTELGDLTQVASDNIYGQTITVNTNTAKSFKMTFENLNGKTFAIRDNVTGSVIDMTKNAEYYFTADAYNGENRFEIVEARKMPTDVEVVDADAAKAQKGIYSLVGAYLGEDFDVLPAGVYVVNGVKVVK